MLFLGIGERDETSLRDLYNEIIDIESKNNTATMTYNNGHLCILNITAIE